MSAQEPSGRAPPRTLPGATILQIIPALTDHHRARSAVDLAFALLRSGARAMIASGDGPLVGELQGFGGEWVRLECETGNPLRLRSNARRLEELIAAERIDLVHASGIGASRSAAAVKARTGTWLVHSYVHADLPRRWHDKRYAAALHHGDRIIAHSDYVAERMIERHDVDAESVTVISRRIDTDHFDPAAVDTARVDGVRLAWKIRRGARIVLAPGRLDPDNGQLNLVDAARLLINGGLRNVVFVLAGDDRTDAEYTRAVKERVRAQGLVGLVRRVGVCLDMPAAYAAADFVVVPSLAPPSFGRVAAEALAMGRPVIASATGALPDIVLAPPRVAERSRTGWLVEPDDCVDLARALAAALSLDHDALRAIGERARRLAEQTFSPAQIAVSTLALYTSLLEGGV